MEKLSGIELERAWPEMETGDRLAIVKTISRYQKAWTSISFGAYGGLYYEKDLASPATNEPLYTDANGIDVIDPKFAIGPSPGRELIDDGRSDVEFDRGPCKL